MRSGECGGGSAPAPLSLHLLRTQSSSLPTKVQIPRYARDDRWLRSGGQATILGVSTGLILRFVLGVILCALGLFIALRPLFTHNAVLTSARWLDVAFAFVFLVRGAMNIKSVLNRRGGMNR